jgi:hypothetical protein
MPTRVLQQVALIGQGAMIVNGGELLKDDLKMLYKTMLDSIPRTNVMVIKEMARGSHQTTAEIATNLGYPTETIRTYLENQALLGVCVREKGDGVADRWTLSDKYAAIIQRYYDIDMLPDQLVIAQQEADLQKNVEEVFPTNPYKESDDIVPML